jgi:hypothetical protein
MRTPLKPAVSAVSALPTVRRTRFMNSFFHGVYVHFTPMCGRIWTPARLQQADWIRRNRHNC